MTNTRTLIAGALLASLTATVQAQDIKSVFIPMTPGVDVPSGSYGQTNKGSFVCYGTVERMEEIQTVFVNAEYNCKGTKATIEEHVKANIKGVYIGSNFVYKSPLLVLNRGVYTVGGSTPGISGVIVYYK